MRCEEKRSAIRGANQGPAAAPLLGAAGLRTPRVAIPPRRKVVDKPHPPTAPAPAQPPYFRSWQATLDPGETPLAVADDLLLCGLYQPEAQARNADTGKIRWRTPLSFHPTWADRSGGVIVTAGDGGAAGVCAGKTDRSSGNTTTSSDRSA